MRSPGDIVLISCYELGHQPLSLALPLAFLKEAGYSPFTIDTAVESLEPKLLSHARLVAISVPMHTAMRLGVAIAEQVRDHCPTAHISFYGHYAALNAEYLLDHCADSVLSGEYEAGLLELARQLESNGPISSPNVGTRGNNAQPILRRLTFPVPDRSPLPGPDQYAHFESNGCVKPAGYVEASRGCLHTCRHCPITPIYGGRFFIIPRDVVLADIRQQVAAGAEHITFGDPDFLNGPGHVLKIVRAMHDEFPHLTFDATIKIEHILQHRALFPELKALGCAFVVSAVESISDNVLRHLEKGHTRADVAAALRILDDAGIPMRPSLLPFTPWSSLEDYLALLEFVEEHDLVHSIDPVHFSIRLLIPPGSSILDEPGEKPWLGELDPAAFTCLWQHPDPRVDQLQASVAARVEQAERDGEDPTVTFRAIKSLAFAAAGLEPPETSGDLQISPAFRRAPPPRLTESWFC